MTYAELAEAATKLPPDERLRLLEAIARSLREDGMRRGRPAAEVRGLFAAAGPPPTDEEVRDMYTAYLAEKVPMTTALLDTNVILDLLLDRPPFATAAIELWEACRAGRYAGYVSAIAPPTIFYVGRRQVGAAAARRGVAEVLAVLGVCPVDAAVLTAALALPLADYEDAIQHASAAAAGVAAIVTRDPAGFAGATLPVLAPAEFLAQLPAQRAGQP